MGSFKTFKQLKNMDLKNKLNAKTGIYKYADIDDDLISIHHFLKVFKFGFSRDFDNLSIETRNNRISRSTAVKLIKKMVLKF